MAEEAFAEADFVVVAVGGFYGEAEDFVAEGDDGRGAGDEEIFGGRRLEDAVVGGVEDEVQAWECNSRHRGAGLRRSD